MFQKTIKKQIKKKKNEAQFMKKLSNTESELKKCCLYKKECTSFNFSVTKIRVAVSLAEDKTKTGGI